MASDDRQNQAWVHVDQNARLAETAPSNVSRQAANSAVTAWTIVAMAIRRSEDSSRVERAWTSAMQAERAAEKSRQFSTDAVRSKLDGDEERQHQYSINAAFQRNIAAYSLYKAAHAVLDKHESSYLAAYKRLQNSSVSLDHTMPVDKTSNHDRDERETGTGHDVDIRSGRRGKESYSIYVPIIGDIDVGRN